MFHLLYYPIINFPSGSVLYLSPFFLAIIAKINEIGPTLPTNIKIIRRHFEKLDKSLVIPVESPVVDIADTTS